jgi:hypothetical protein
MTDKVLTGKDGAKSLRRGVDLYYCFLGFVPQVLLYLSDIAIAYNKDLKGVFSTDVERGWPQAYIGETVC